eukprot:TRINITY_DN3585_c0_g1_i1.p1 TRINITY_DN3585_c0_g1~~TRINITY_DN3585_c0_g1_i1.p1  ORF type:complete len:241 (+),score=49.96 TRINITY_DN3585_c0_g1_i1:26-748(+)
MYQYHTVIIGGGIIGLSVSSRLGKQHNHRKQLLIESSSKIGTGISSRNSQVIHAGLYYPSSSLKSELCIRGNQMMYDLCDEFGVRYQNVGKVIFAQKTSDVGYLESLKDKAAENGVPLRFMSTTEIKEMEPNINVQEALFSERTGIVDVHGLMQYHLQCIESSDSDVAFNCEFVSCEKVKSGYRVGIYDKISKNIMYIECTHIINAAGLNSDKVAQIILKDSFPSEYKMHYCKGHYIGYR